MRRDVAAEASELAVDAAVAPGRVLLGEAYDELFEVPRSAGPPGPALGMHPPTRGEAAVPVQQCVGGDDEPRQHPTRQEPGEAGEQSTSGLGEGGAWHMAVQYGDLVTQRDGFGFERSARLRTGHQQANDGDEQPVEDRTDTRIGTAVRCTGRRRRTVSTRRLSQPAGTVDRLRRGS